MKKIDATQGQTTIKTAASSEMVRSFVETAQVVDLAAWLERIPCDEALKRLPALPLPLTS